MSSKLPHSLWCHWICRLFILRLSAAGFLSLSFSVLYPQLSSRRLLSLEQTSGGTRMFVGPRQLGSKQSAALCALLRWTRPEHTGLSSFTTGLTHPSCTCLPSSAAQTVCEWGSFSIQLARPLSAPLAPLLPNKHCTGNCRDIWDFWGGDWVERSKRLEQGCSLWHLLRRGEGQDAGGVGRTGPKERAWPCPGWREGLGTECNMLQTGTSDPLSTWLYQGGPLVRVSGTCS